MDNRYIEDLLPGIEEYICGVLAGQPLSPEAEEQRQYFVERLDIIKLPPSIPPRPKNIGVLPVQLYPIQDKFHAHNPIPPYEQEDFAAFQREISRALVASNSGSLASLIAADAKVYDDIEPKDVGVKAGVSQIEDEESMYEIPQINRTLSDSGYEKAIDISSISKLDSVEENNSKPTTMGPPPPSPCPPPLPPRGDRNASDSTSRGSIGSLIDEKLLDASAKLNILNREFSVSSQPEKRYSRASERSSDDMLGEFTDQCDGASIDSLDGSSCQDSSGKIFKKPGVKLPKPVQKKKKRHRKVGQSLSSSLWEVTQPFRALDDISLSGDLHYRSKLSWTKKLVALTNGRMVCYKPAKIDTRPTVVILLNGYQATFQKREGRRGFEILLCHDNLESHLLLADFKEWAQIWCEYINCAADGQKAPGLVQHLARGTVIESLVDGNYTLGKSGLRSSTSNISTASSDGFDSEPGTVKVKKINQSGVKTARMGTFAYKATQFFESFGKKSSKKAPFSERGYKESDAFRMRSSSTGATPKKMALFQPVSPTTPESGIIESPHEVVTRHVKCQGFLDVYSSFNKRRWGKRWCMVQDNSFECYRTQTSEVCELEFLLHKCILRRAIEETKSQLGLMLLDSNREKITVEPLNWDEMGSWLRVLMKETSTPAIPEGLESYMVDMHPYTEAREICRLSDPFPHSPMSPLASPECNSSNSNSNCRDWQTTSRRQNCDSGNYSAESFDGCFKPSSLDRRTIEVHPCYSDSSLPRVNVNENGDLYTKIRKSSTTASPVTDSSTIPTSNAAHGNSKTDFENSESGSSFQHEESMVDEILSKFSSQISGGFLLDEEFDLENSSNQKAELSGLEVCNFVTNDMCDTESDLMKSKSINLQELDTIISPIKGITDKYKTSEITEDSFLCSSFVEEPDNASTNETLDQKTFHQDCPVDQICGKADEISTRVLGCDTNSNNVMENAVPVVETTESNARTEIYNNENVDKNSNDSRYLLENHVDVVNNLENINIGIKRGNVDNVVKDINGNTDISANTHVETDGRTNLSQEFVKVDDHATDTGNVTNLDCIPNGDFVTNFDHVTTSPVNVRDHARDPVQRTLSSGKLCELEGPELKANMEELRVKLVQLKKDRISIRDRKQQTTSETDRDFMEAEFNRLNIECLKVTDEISYLENLLQPDATEEKSGTHVMLTNEVERFSEGLANLEF